MAEGTFPPCKLIMLKNNSPNTIVIQGPKEIHGFDPQNTLKPLNKKQIS